MLTQTQMDARRGKLTASKVGVLMNGKADEIMQLYKIMIGEEQEDDLSDNWPVQLGVATEPLNLWWYGKKNGGSVPTRQGEVVVHPQYPWAACTLDGWNEILKCPVECKCVRGRQPLEVLIDQWQPQLQYQMECTGATAAALSVIIAGDAPVIEYIDRDAEYAAEMMKRGQKFMTCVAARLPPVTLPAVPAPVPHDDMIEVDMTADATWQKSAGVYIQTYQAAASAKEAEKILKSLVADNVRRAYGAGIRITRDKAGRLSLREDR